MNPTQSKSRDSEGYSFVCGRRGKLQNGVVKTKSKFLLIRQDVRDDTNSKLMRPSTLKAATRPNRC